jgi:putative ABC transport system substrate-binding protein
LPWSGDANEAARFHHASRRRGGWPLVAVAQQSGIPVIGYLGLTSARADAYLLAPFRKALREAGFDEGRNVIIEYRFAERDVSRLPQLASELVRRNVSVILTGTTVSALATKAATSTIPVIFAIGADPVKSGLVTSLNRPGGNLTGISFFTNQMEAKRLALLHEIVPKAELVGVLLNPNNPFFANQSSDVAEASRALNLKIHIERASNEQEIAKAFKEFTHRKQATSSPVSPLCAWRRSWIAISASVCSQLLYGETFPVRLQRSFGNLIFEGFLPLEIKDHDTPPSDWCRSSLARRLPKTRAIHRWQELAVPPLEQLPEIVGY